MNRNSKIVLLFLSTIISIILIFIAYYGIDRYIMMHVNSIDKYVDNYHKLDSIPDKVVVSFCTTQDKLNKIKPMINSLLDQTIKINKIDMNLPPKKTDYKIPKEYKNICNVHFIGKDYGSGNNIIPTLLRTKEKGTKIMYLDDNIVYGKDFFQQMITESNKYPNNAIINKKNNKICAAIVKPEFFTIDIIDNNQKYFDDDWIKKHLIDSPKEFKYIENYKIS